MGAYFGESLIIFVWKHQRCFVPRCRVFSTKFNLQLEFHLYASIKYMFDLFLEAKLILYQANN